MTHMVVFIDRTGHTGDPANDAPARQPLGMPFMHNANMTPVSSRSLISNHYLRASISGAIRKGADPKLLLAEAGIPFDWLDCHEQLISDQQLSSLIKVVWRTTRDEFMGLSPTPCNRGVFALMAEFAYGAKSLGGMLQRSARFYTAVSNDLKINLALKNSQRLPLAFYQLHIEHNGEDADHLLQEFIMLIWQRFSSWLTGQQLPITYTTFSHPCPAHTHEYRAMYLGEIHYEQPTSGFYIHPRYFQLPIIRNKFELKRFLESCPGIILNRPVQDNSLHKRIKILLQGYDLDKMPDTKEISDALLSTPRTLRRKLTVEGTSLRQIKEDIRCDYALKLLASEHLTIQEIAEQNGFSESAAFCRAFKRWKGCSPAQWRIQHVRESI